jgi:ABC-type sulfate transport system permease component
MSLATAVQTSMVLTETVHARELAFDPIWFGVIVFAVFASLGVVVYSYRDVANRHRSKAEAYAARHAGGEHGGH